MEAILEMFTSLLGNVDLSALLGEIDLSGLLGGLDITTLIESIDLEAIISTFTTAVSYRSQIIATFI